MFKVALLFVLAPSLLLLTSTYTNRIAQNHIASRRVPTISALIRSGDHSLPVSVDANGGLYEYKRAPCLSNSGGGDGGTQLPDSTGVGCWVVADFVPITTDLFMVDRTGSTDVTASLQNALNAAAARHQPLSLCGTFKTSKALTLASNDPLINSTSGIVGCGSSRAVILTTDANQDGVFFSGRSFGQMFRCIVRDLTIQGPRQNFKISGSAVHILNGNECRIENLVIQNQYTGVYLDSTALSYVAFNAIKGLTSADMSQGSTAIALHGTDVGSLIFANYADNAAMKEPSTGISLNDNVNGEYIEENSMSHFVVGFNAITHGGDKIQNIFSRQNAYDMSAAIGMNFQADGSIYRIFSVNDWSAATRSGPCLMTGGFGHAPNVQASPAMSNWQFESFQCRDNGDSGIVLGGNLKNVTFVNLVSTANNVEGKATDDAGVVLQAPVSHVSFVGGIDGPTAEEFNRQDFAFSIAPGVDFVMISNMDMSGNRTGPITDRAETSTHNVFVNNLGYNPVGASSVKVGPSPWNYRAGPSSETLYVRSGACSRVRQQNVIVSSSCSALVPYQLGPNETLALDYTTAPTITRVVH